MSEPELAVLSRYAWMSDERIRLKLKAAGHTRTVTAIHLKLRRMNFKHDGSFYSAYSLAQALGIDPHAVTRWIKSGHLKVAITTPAEVRVTTWRTSSTRVACFCLRPTAI